MARKILVAKTDGLLDAVTSLFGVIDTEAQLKASRILGSARRKLDTLARNARSSRKKHVALRERRQERSESIKAKQAQSILTRANQRPSHCRRLLKLAKQALPAGHMIALVPSTVGFQRQLDRA